MSPIIPRIALFMRMNLPGLATTMLLGAGVFLQLQPLWGQNDGQKKESPLSEKELKFFEAEVRPILIEHCYACHSVESGNAEAGLRLDSKQASQKGGSSGPAVVPGDLKSSLLIRAIRYEDKEFAMPPADSGGKLSIEKIAILEQWVRRGAPDPRIESVNTVDHYQQAKSWWAYQPITTQSVPKLADSGWSYTDIDRFVEAKHLASNLKPAETANPNTLFRRIYFDLVGLPPSPQELDDFNKRIAKGESLRDALATVTDRLIGSDQFGMHWGRHWLDVARYAESSGKDINIAYPHAWRYRDYVIDAWNQNIPYDQFLKEQIAGDLLPAKSEADRIRQTIATGFLAIGSKSLNERDPRQFAVDLADEQIDSLFQATMGLTVGCARCHDHKFDPIPQKDYTAIAGIFLSTETKFGTSGGPQSRNNGSLAELPSTSRVARPKLDAKQMAELKSRKQEVDSEIEKLIAERSKDGSPNPKLLRAGTLKAAIDGELRSYNSDGTPKALAMAVSDKSMQGSRGRFINMRGPGRRPSAFDSIGDSPLFVRGDIERAGSTVPRGLLSMFESSRSVSIPKTASGRKELAEWIVSKENPMTARVAVNRIWYWIFGQGLVPSLDNFGSTGSAPSNPELLDYLAKRFVDSGWNSKALIREIVSSHTYQLSTEYNESNFKLDPDNNLLWRANRRRLTGEEIRDSLLSASGQLSTSPIVGSVIGRAGDVPIGGIRGRGLAEDEIVQLDANYRSIYLPIARNVVPEVLETFDLPDASAVQTEREATNVPTQSLYMLNSGFVSKQSSEVANRILAQYPGKLASDQFASRLNLAYELVFARKPTPSETRLARKLIETKNKQPLSAWGSLSRSLFATAEFRYLD